MKRLDPMHLFFITIGIIGILLFAATCFAQETITEERTVTTILDEMKLSVTADILYDFTSGELLGGFGLPLAEGWDGLVELKFEMTGNLDPDKELGEDNLMGIGLGTDILKLFKLLPDWNWVAYVQPKLGFTVMLNLDEKINDWDDIHIVGYLNLLEKQF